MDSRAADGLGLLLAEQADATGFFAQNGLLLLAIAIIVLTLLALWSLRAKTLPYHGRPSLLTDAELVFFKVLRESVDNQFAICAMVRMADLIRVQPKTPKYQSWQNRIQAKHIDFVLCDHDSMEIRLAIELDDRSHERKDRQDRDAFVNEAFEAAQVPLLRVPVKNEYDVDSLKAALAEALGA